MKKVLVIHGPNLNLLGTREPQIYGKTTLKDINEGLKAVAAKLKIQLIIKQSNVEGEIVGLIQHARGKFNGILLNPAAYTHTSVAIRDALAACAICTVEIHLSNIYSREEFRQKSLISPVVTGSIFGFGANSYYLGLQALAKII